MVIRFDVIVWNKEELPETEGDIIFNIAAVPTADEES
jgi:hypothetical protein